MEAREELCAYFPQDKTNMFKVFGSVRVCVCVCGREREKSRREKLSLGEASPQTLSKRKHCEAPVDVKDMMNTDQQH